MKIRSRIPRHSSAHFMFLFTLAFSTLSFVNSSFANYIETQSVPICEDRKECCKNSERYPKINAINRCSRYYGILDRALRQLKTLNERVKADTPPAIPAEANDVAALRRLASQVEEKKSQLQALVAALEGQPGTNIRKVKRLVEMVVEDDGIGIRAYKAAKFGRPCEVLKARIEAVQPGNQDDRDSLQAEFDSGSKRCIMSVSNPTPTQEFNDWLSWANNGYMVPSAAEKSANAMNQEFRVLNDHIVKLEGEIDRIKGLSKAASAAMEEQAGKLKTLIASLDSPDGGGVRDKLRAEPRVEPLTPEQRLAAARAAREKALIEACTGECNVEALKARIKENPDMLDPRLNEGGYTAFERDGEKINLQVGTGRVLKDCPAGEGVCGTYDEKIDTSDFSKDDWEAYYGKSNVTETLGESYRKDWKREDYIAEIEKTYGADVAQIFKDAQGASGNAKAEALQRVLGTNLVDGDVGPLTMAQALRDGIPADLKARYEKVYNGGEVDATALGLATSLDRSISSFTPAVAVDELGGFGEHLAILERGTGVVSVAVDTTPGSGVKFEPLQVTVGDGGTATNVLVHQYPPNSPLTDHGIRRLTSTEVASLSYKDVAPADMYQRLFVNSGKVYLCPEGTSLSYRAQKWSCYTN